MLGATVGPLLAAALLAGSREDLLLVVAATLPAMRKSRDEVFQESD
jgi:hypothetical protein